MASVSYCFFALVLKTRDMSTHSLSGKIRLSTSSGSEVLSHARFSQCQYCHQKFHLATLSEVAVAFSVVSQEPPLESGRLSGLGFAVTLIASRAWHAWKEGGPPKYLCAVTAGSEPTLVLMNWESEKILAKCKLPGTVDRVAFPFQHDRTDVTVSGPHMLRLLQIRHAKGEVTLKPMPAFSGLQEKAQAILDHTWLEAGRGLLGLCVHEGPVYILSADELILGSSSETLSQVICFPNYGHLDEPP